MDIDHFLEAELVDRGFTTEGDFLYEKSNFENHLRIIVDLEDKELVLVDDADPNLNYEFIFPQRMFNLGKIDLLCKLIGS